MPPVGDSRDVRSIIQEHIDQNKVAIFSKSHCGFCKKVWLLFCTLICYIIIAISVVCAPVSGLEYCSGFDKLVSVCVYLW